ncbi:hypothetical protein [Amycolatopsis pigmentata]|uniref:Uncharacterized protein n=1 Tax=Amycolatopsis pigmentata TaxID=450801 RepID=A0ABW5FRH0_9PSEU
MDVIERDDCVSGVAEQLAREFGKSVPRADIEEVVATARRDLDGQVPPHALDELLHRLAHYRLSQLSPA